jgi:hypothetical protein
MTMTLKHDVKTISHEFQIFGEFVSADPYGSGHINDTYLATYNVGGTIVRYIHQRVNHNIFKNVPALMENIERVTKHIGAKLGGSKDWSRQTLTIIPARDGKAFHKDVDGNFWRTYIFIEKAKTYDAIESPVQAFEAAKAFGAFQGKLADFPAPRLNDTIPDFHNTPKRFAALEAALAADVKDRAKLAKPELDFVMSRKAMTRELLDLNAQGLIPERITHNDTKLNNVMLDDATGKGVCVIDLDTVMPGLALYDFGDMVRTATSPAKEDEKDLSLVHMQFPMFEALARGYLESAGGFLTKTEKSRLAFSGKLITLEIGIRFLTDFLAGDTYFKVHREGHNLDRCRTQFKLVESIESQESAMNKLVESL